MRALFRPVAFAFGGAVPIAVLLSLILIAQPTSVLGYIFKAAGLGVICWLGVLLGNALWKLRNGQAFSNTPRLLFIAGVLMGYTALGRVDQLIRTKNNSIAENIVPFAIAGASLLHGFAVGFNKRPNAALGAIAALWISVILGACFGIGEEITVLTTPMPTCTPGIHCFYFSPILAFITGFLLILVVGFGVGLANAAASSIGLLLCPIQPQGQVDE